MTAKVLEMRQAFDAGFARPFELELEQKQGAPALVIGLGASKWLVRLRDIMGVARARPPLPVPGGSSALLGLTGVRGALVPVYSMAVLLGLAEGPKVDAIWLALVAHGGTLGLAFDALVRHASLAEDQVHFASSGSAVCQLGDEQLPIIDVMAVVASIGKGTRG